jgi:cation diffusion facilitator CzcD-associated flavoprotein CzcO
MILDFDELPDGHVLSADLAIVGAGAAGITLAHEFASSRAQATGWSCWRAAGASWKDRSRSSTLSAAGAPARAARLGWW